MQIASRLASSGSKSLSLLRASAYFRTFEMAEFVFIFCFFFCFNELKSK